MRDKDEFLVTEFLGQRAQVFNHVLDLILIEVGGFGREIISSHIRCYGKVFSSELFELVLPFVPELRKAVNKHNQLPLACRGIMQPDAVHVGIFVLYHRRPRSRFRFLFFSVVFLAGLDTKRKRGHKSYREREIDQSFSHMNPVDYFLSRLPVFSGLSG